MCKKQLITRVNIIVVEINNLEIANRIAITTKKKFINYCFSSFLFFIVVVLVFVFVKLKLKFVFIFFKFKFFLIFFLIIVILTTFVFAIILIVFKAIVF